MSEQQTHKGMAGVAANEFGAGTVLVTGGAGFIGQKVVQRLLQAQHPVRVLDLAARPASAAWAAHPKLEWQVGDITDAQAVQQAMTGVQRVVHLAALVSVPLSLAQPTRTAHTNGLGFVQVLEAARLAGVQRLVYASSAAVYGQPQHLPLSETSATQPLSPYGLEKLGNEQYAALYRQLHGFNSLGLRYFNVYGPGQNPESSYAGVLTHFARAMAQHQPLRLTGDGRQSRDFIHVQDVAEATYRALFVQTQGVLNIGTGLATSLLDIHALLQTMHGKALPVQNLPPAQGDIRHSWAETQGMQQALGMWPMCPLSLGLREVLLG